MITSPVVIITGVSSGIGLATAQYFNEQGWVVVGTVRDRAKLPDELAIMNLDLQVVEMTEPKQIAELVKRTNRTYGRIDAVVASAGYAVVGALEEVEYEQFQHQLSVNVASVGELVHQVMPIMRKQKNGTICVLSSIAGRTALPEYGAYSASKFALEGMFESLWYEVQGSGIKLRLIEPSSVKTAFWTRGLVKVTAKRPIRIANHFLARTVRFGALSGLLPQDVARKIYQSVTSNSNRLHWPIGLTRGAVVLRKLLPDALFRHLVLWYINR